MAIQDLINEVNSIQTKKNAIKEAINAKGVTSEGKLSKFADEIKQITTREPDWYIVNKFRYENGNEALMVRTSDKDAIMSNKFQMAEMSGGMTRDNSISSAFNVGYNDDFGITNGTYFPRETAYRSFTTKEDRSVVFDGHNDNLKITLSDGKELVFSDVNSYNWLKGYRNNRIADYNTLYLKCGGINSSNKVVSLTDFLAVASASSTQTLGTYGATPLVLIDSSVMVQAMKFAELKKQIGFIYYSDKSIDSVYLAPIRYSNVGSSYTSTNVYKNKEQIYGNLGPGNYAHLLYDGDLLIVFVSVNFVIDSNNQKHKNIEVYAYKITKGLNSTGYISIDKNKLNNPFELYISFYSQIENNIRNYSSVKVFRRQVLTANGTPEPLPMYLNGLDMLGRFSSIRGNYVSNDRQNDLFSYQEGTNEVRYYKRGSDSDSPFRSMHMARNLGEAIKAKSPIKAFIRINDDSNAMYMIDFEEIQNDGNFTFYPVYGYGLTVFQKGINNNNRVLAVFIDESDRNKCKIYQLKKAGTNQYITNDMFNTTKTDSYIFITVNQPTIDHLNKTPLKTVWTEIQDVLAHKEDYEAYNER